MRTSKTQYQALVKINYDLFTGEEGNVFNNDRRIVDHSKTECSGKLPDVNTLYYMFDEFNAQLFNQSLPRVKISYSERMLIAGSFTPVSQEIKIGKKYHKIFPDDLPDTLKHEMIHIIHPRHDRRFKALAARLSVSLRAKPHPSLRGAYKYLYICPACGREYPRRKRLRMASCGICSKGSKFDPKFKLQLKDAKK